MEKPNKFKSHACEFKNEDECEEELDEDEVDLQKQESDFYEED